MEEETPSRTRRPFSYGYHPNTVLSQMSIFVGSKQQLKLESAFSLLEEPSEQREREELVPSLHEVSLSLNCLDDFESPRGDADRLQSRPSLRSS